MSVNASRISMPALATTTTRGSSRYFPGGGGGEETPGPASASHGDSNDLNRICGRIQTLRVEKIARLLQSLGGHLFGEFVVKAMVHGDSSTCLEIECTMPAYAIPNLPGVLSASGLEILPSHSHPVDDETGQGGGWRRTWRAIVNENTMASCEIVASPFYSSTSTDVRHMAVFDWQLLGLSKDRLYVRRQAMGSQNGAMTGDATHSADRLMRLMHRAREGVFCISPGAIVLADCGLGMESPSGASSEDHERAVALWHEATVRKTVELLRSAFFSRMDDWMLGRRVWVVSSWARLASARQPVVGVNPKTHDQCAICHERFEDPDLIINLPCNHNFHVACHRAPVTPSAMPPPPTGGLSAWLRSGKASCPCCRASLFKQREC